METSQIFRGVSTRGKTTWGETSSGGGGDWTCGDTHEPKRLGGEMDLWRDIPDSPRITRTFSGCYFFFSINAAKSEIIKMSRISHQMSPNENSKLVLT